MTRVLLVTPAGALPCPPRSQTPKAACSVVWVRAGPGGAREGWGPGHSPGPTARLSHSAEPLHGQHLPAGRPARQPAPAAVVRAAAEVPAAEGVGRAGEAAGPPPPGWGWGAWGETWRPEHPCRPQNFSSPLPSPAGMLEPLVLDGKELPQVCVGAEGPEGPGCRVLFHVLPLEASLTPDVLIPPGEPEGPLCVCVCVWDRELDSWREREIACSLQRMAPQGPASLQLGFRKRFH